MAQYGIPDNPALKTNSWLRAWWLHSVWGYQVVNKRRQPRLGWFGSTTYEDVYVLLPRTKPQARL